MRTVSAYALCECDTNEIRYIGITRNGLQKRFIGHLTEARNGGMNYKDKWIRSLLAYGCKPSIVRLGTCDEQYADDMERFWIAYYRSRGARLTNLTDGGESNVAPAPEVCARISAKRKGWNPSPETRKRMSEAAKRKAPMSKAAREKLSRAFKGRVSPTKGMKFPGRTFTDEAKQKMSEAAKRKPPISEETRSKLSRAVKADWLRRKGAGGIIV